MRTTSFGIIGHQTGNENFTKQNNWDSSRPKDRVTLRITLMTSDNLHKEQDSCEFLHL